VAGFLLAAGALLNGQFAHEKRFVAAFATVLLWPFLALISPQIFLRDSKDATPALDQLKVSLEQLGTSETLPLSDEEAGHLRMVAEQGEINIAYFDASAACGDVLNAFWELNIPPSVYNDLKAARRALEEPKPDSGVRFSLRTPDWYIGFSNEFLKSIMGIDRKLQGRILEAISKIGDTPTTPIGDTIKPLTGDLAGLWRYRVGDNRLVYFLHQPSRRITLICFGSRGRIYENLPNTATLTLRSPPVVNDKVG
jgi:mRNA interferase RelE/StbE